MKRLDSKPCIVCGIAVAGRKRPDKAEYHYPQRCPSCSAVSKKRENNPNWGGGFDPVAYRRSHRPDYARRQRESFARHAEEIRARARGVRRVVPERLRTHVLARRAVWLEVQAGRMVPAKMLSCSDCAAPARDYDHFKGYAEADWLAVQPVCRRCHGQRAADRGELIRVAA